MRKEHPRCYLCFGPGAELSPDHEMPLCEVCRKELQYLRVGEDPTVKEDPT